MKTSVLLAGVSALVLGAAFGAAAQSPYVGESLNYSRLQFGGPARTQGIAGANVALGADFGNLSSNPAGLGLYQKSEVNFSPGVGIGSAEATGLTAGKNSFHVGSVGGVFTNRLADDDNSSDWRGGSFALGFARVADFNASFQYANRVDNNRSFFQYLREPNRAAFGTLAYQDGIKKVDKQIGPVGSTPVYSNLDGLAYGAFLTDFDSTSRADRLITRRAASNGRVSQGETVTIAGSVSQLDFGYGGSYKNRLFVGGAVGIVSSNRRTTRAFNGSSANDTVRFDIRDENLTNGRGFNARIGAIYRLNDVVRVGLSVQTPTFMQLEDTYSTSLTSTYSPAIRLKNRSVFTGATVSTPEGNYAYALTTPFRANGGVALTAGKLGFLTADVEYVGYGQARLSGQPDNANGDDNTFNTENQGIQNAFRNTVNVRLGAEARLAIFRLRAGFAHYGDPNRGGSGLARNQRFYTAGLGLRQNNFFLDVAGVYTTFNQQYSSYQLVGGREPVIGIANARYTTTVTAGFTF